MALLDAGGGGTSSSGFLSPVIAKALTTVQNLSGIVAAAPQTIAFVQSHPNPTAAATISQASLPAGPIPSSLQGLTAAQMSQIINTQSWGSIISRYGNDGEAYLYQMAHPPAPAPSTGGIGTGFSAMSGGASAGVTGTASAAPIGGGFSVPMTNALQAPAAPIGGGFSVPMTNALQGGGMTGTPTSTTPIGGGFSLPLTNALQNIQPNAAGLPSFGGPDTGLTQGGYVAPAQAPTGLPSMGGSDTGFTQGGYYNPPSGTSFTAAPTAPTSPTPPAGNYSNYVPPVPVGAATNPAYSPPVGSPTPGSSPSPIPTPITYQNVYGANHSGIYNAYGQLTPPGVMHGALEDVLAGPGVLNHVQYGPELTGLSGYGGTMTPNGTPVVMSAWQGANLDPTSIANYGDYAHSIAGWNPADLAQYTQRITGNVTDATLPKNYAPIGIQPSPGGG